MEVFDRVAVLHSSLTERQRSDQWWDIKSGNADVVVGARSAIFAPLEDVGLIVIDEEHENTFKQDTSPRYNARDVSVVRAAYENAVVVLDATSLTRNMLHTIWPRCLTNCFGACMLESNHKQLI